MLQCSNFADCRSEEVKFREKKMSAGCHFSSVKENFIGTQCQRQRAGPREKTTSALMHAWLLVRAHFRLLTSSPCSKHSWLLHTVLQACSPVYVYIPVLVSWGHFCLFSSHHSYLKSHWFERLHFKVFCVHEHLCSIHVHTSEWKCAVVNICDQRHSAPLFLTFPYFTSCTPC